MKLSFSGTNFSNVVFMMSIHRRDKYNLKFIYEKNLPNVVSWHFLDLHPYVVDPELVVYQPTRYSPLNLDSDKTPTVVRRRASNNPLCWCASVDCASPCRCGRPASEDGRVFHQHLSCVAYHCC